MKNRIKLIISLILPQLAGIVGSLFTPSSSWYESLIKPVFTPPGWIFGPVWITLYFLMGFAFYLIWKKGLNNKRNRVAFILFLIHLVFNALWSVIFFGANKILISFIDISILWIMIIVLTVLFWKIRKLAGYLMIPYLIWVSYALILNYAILNLNSFA